MEWSGHKYVKLYEYGGILTLVCLALRKLAFITKCSLISIFLHTRTINYNNSVLCYSCIITNKC